MGRLGSARPGLPGAPSSCSGSEAQSPESCRRSRRGLPATVLRDPRAHGLVCRMTEKPAARSSVWGRAGGWKIA